MTIPSKIGRYEVIERVGRGGMGAVYRGRDTVLDREVAIKVMSSDFAADETSRPRFYREARAAAKLQHRNIVTIFEFGEEDETPFIVMEFLRGEDLSKRLRLEPPLTLGQKIEIVAELCTGLHFAHEQGVIHRDVKPANIWLTPDGSVKLLDFGIAKFSASTLTRQGSVFGSISYMSPEQVNGLEVDGRADIFSAGVVLFELLSGRKPFTGDSPTAVLASIMDDEPAPVAELPLDLPRALVSVVLKALEKDRERRYRHASEMGADLRMVRTALASVASAIDLADTRFTDGATVDSGRQPAGSVPVTRTAPLSTAGADTGQQRSPSGRVATTGTGRQRPGQAALDHDLLGDATIPQDQSSATGGPPVSSGSRTWMVLLAAVLVVALGTGGWYFVTRKPSPASNNSSATAASAKSLIKLESQPTGARIVIDDVDTGRVTPAEFEVDDSQLPRVTLRLGGRASVTSQVTRQDVQKGSLVLHLDRLAAEKASATPASKTAPASTVPAASSAPPAAAEPPKTRVVVAGDYPFEIVENGRVVSPEAKSHDLKATPRSRLFLRSEEYFLNQAVQLDGSPEFEYQAPGLGTLHLTAGETCNVTIGGRNLGEPPIDVKIAAGTHVAEVSCGAQAVKRQTFTVSAGALTNVSVR